MKLRIVVGVIIFGLLMMNILSASAGETLLIETDKDVYYGLTQAVVYVNITNTGKSADFIRFASLFPEASGAEVKELYELQTTKEEITVEDYGTCTGEIPANGTTVSVSYPCITGSHKERVTTEKWVPLRPKATVLASKRVPKHFKAKRVFENIKINPGEKKQLKMVITFPINSKGEFWLEAEGSKGYGLLDPWWDSTWLRKRPVTIHNPGDPLTDYQILLNVSYDNDMQPDFSDLRFVNSTQDGELSYWIEDYASASYASVWVKIPALPQGNTTIYMYYSNENVGSTGNPDEVFDFYDDFEGTGLDSNKWENGCFGLSGVSYTISDSVIKFPGGGCGGYCSDHRCLRMKGSFSETDQPVIETRFKFTGSSWGTGVIWWQNVLFENGITWCDGTSDNRIGVRGRGFYNTYWDMEYVTTSGTSGRENLAQLSMGSWYRSTLIKKNSTSFEGIIFDDNGAMLGSHEYNIGDYTNVNTWVWATVPLYSCGSRYHYLDYVRVRKYASLEPEATIGPEEVWEYSSSFNVSSGVSKLTAAVYWYGTTPSARVVMGLVNPEGVMIHENQTATIIRNSGNTDGIYSGYKAMTITDPASGTWELKANGTDILKVTGEWEVS